MANFVIVTDKDSDWRQYFPSEQVVTVDQYLQPHFMSEKSEKHKSVQVINLCRDYSYMSSGYYCSLLAEARGHRVIPRVMAINDVGQPFVFSLPEQELNKNFTHVDSVATKIYFGRSSVKGLEKVARRLFEHFMIPVLDIELKCHGKQWQLAKVQPFPFQDLSNDEQDIFAQSLEQFSNKVWRSPKPSKQFRYDIAMLVDPEEKMPPSDSVALNRFKKAANRLGVNLETITSEDFSRLSEFDGLFIRATTNISNFTYRFAKRAEKLGLVVIDDPESIMKCTNKVFLTELLDRHNVPAPKSMILRSFDPDWKKNLLEHMSLPLVLKIPDGAFSVGVVKVTDEASLEEKAQALFDKSALILAQAFMPTDFDWRIGVMNRQAIYACRYHMSRGHWQIYQHHNSGRTTSGGFDTLDLKQVPKNVVDTAVKAANLIGSGLYGVDLKEVDGQVYVIEVNDNPSIDNKVEDLWLGDLLYDRIMTEFLRRIQLRGF